MRLCFCTLVTALHKRDRKGWVLGLSNDTEALLSRQGLNRVPSCVFRILLLLPVIIVVIQVLHCVVALQIDDGLKLLVRGEQITSTRCWLLLSWDLDVADLHLLQVSAWGARLSQLLLDELLLGAWTCFGRWRVASLVLDGRSQLV